jgi:hypothetical protein
MSKLFWSPEEWAQVRGEAVRLLVETPYLRKEQVLERAQSVLPEGRRRQATYSAVHRYKTFLEECRQLAKDQRQAPTKAEPAPVASTDAILVALEGLLDKLADKIADRLAARLAVQVQTQTRTTTHNCCPEPTTPPVPPRPTVLIVGLLGAQCHQIKNSFAHRLDITCLTSEEANVRATLHKEHTVLMTKFLSHPVQGKYRKHPGLRLCNGGTTELARILKEIA